MCAVFCLTYSGLAQAKAHESLFGKGRWIKIETSASGIHRIEYAWLKNAGFAHPENVKIFGSRNEPLASWNIPSAWYGPAQIPVLKIKAPGGSEALLFYVGGDISWQHDPINNHYYHRRNQAARGKSWFFLTEDSGIDLIVPMAEQFQGSAETISTSYDDFGLWEEENINLLESGSIWFTSLIAGGKTLGKSFSFQDRLDNESVVVSVCGAGRSSIPSGIEVTINNSAAGNILFRPIQPSLEADFAVIDSTKTSKKLVGPTVNLSVGYKAPVSDQSWLDFATVMVRRSLIYRGLQLIFRDGRSVGGNRSVEYRVSGASPGLQLWEISNPLSPCRINYQLSNDQLVFRQKSDILRCFLLFDPQGPYPGVTNAGVVPMFDLFPNEVPQYLVIAPASFLNQAERLARFHRESGDLKVSVVSTEAIFNEYSGGYPDISALRNYISTLYQQKDGANQPILKYLLLLGKGTCDPVHEAGDSNPNWIPTWQSMNSVSSVNSFVSDDFFGRLDPGEGGQTGDIDLGIGRIPAATIAEATIAIDKIMHYKSTATLGDWRTNVCFIGDDEDNNLHVNDSEKLAQKLGQTHPEYNISKIYFDAYPQVLTPDERYPEVTEAIRRSVQTGNLFVNYIGHASEDGLAHERVLTNKDIDSWTNKDRLPLFVTATCEFSRWDMSVKRSAGEHLFFNPAGGSIALFSATRLVYSSSNYEINQSFINHVFDSTDSGDFLRLGDLIRTIKNENGQTINTAKFCLLGDPALRLNYPENQTKDLKINNIPVEQFDGALSPTNLVTISGEILDRSGELMEKFDGNLSAQVFDQPTKELTLGNAGMVPFSYQVQKNILFKGNVPVRKGNFTYSFVVPKDVNFEQKTGVIRYYFSNSTTDGNGSFANIHFNGTNSPAQSDHQGPSIRLYLENESFRAGGVVSSKPLLLVYLTDESGINTSSNGIGHDITLELDGQTTSRIILNEFYKTDGATWKSGTLQYALSSLSEGTHSLVFKVWDSVNNSSAVKVDFMVNEGLAFVNLYNYPNPFSDQTRFFISHNGYNELLWVDLEVMDLSGRVVDKSRQLLPSRGYENTDLYWNPARNGLNLANGIYPYRITLTDQAGHKSEKAGRIILKK